MMQVATLFVGWVVCVVAGGVANVNGCVVLTWQMLNLTGCRIGLACVLYCVVCQRLTSKTRRKQGGGVRLVSLLQITQRVIIFAENI